MQSEAWGYTWVWAVVGRGCLSEDKGSDIRVGEAILLPKVVSRHLPLLIIIFTFPVLLRWLALYSSTPGWGRGRAGSWRRLSGEWSGGVWSCAGIIIIMGHLYRRADRDGDGRISVEEILTVFKVRY